MHGQGVRVELTVAKNLLSLCIDRQHDLVSNAVLRDWKSYTMVEVNTCQMVTNITHVVHSLAFLLILVGAAEKM